MVCFISLGHQWYWLLPLNWNATLGSHNTALSWYFFISLWGLLVNILLWPLLPVSLKSWSSPGFLLAFFSPIFLHCSWSILCSLGCHPIDKVTHVSRSCLYWAFPTANWTAPFGSSAAFSSQPQHIQSTLHPFFQHPNPALLCSDQ